MPFDSPLNCPGASLLESLCRLPGSAVVARAGRYDGDAQAWIEPTDNVPPPKGLDKPPKDFDEVVRVFQIR